MPWPVWRGDEARRGDGSFPVSLAVPPIPFSHSLITPLELPALGRCPSGTQG